MRKQTQISRKTSRKTVAKQSQNSENQSKSHHHAGALSVVRRRAARVDQDLPDPDRDLAGRHDENAADQAEEQVVVLAAHAVVQPLAVVVEVFDALVARAAVLRALLRSVCARVRRMVRRSLQIKLRWGVVAERTDTQQLQ